MAARIPDSLERLTQADLIGVVRDLIGEVGRLRAENEKLGGAFMTICCGPPRPRHPSLAIELVPVRVQTATDIERSIEVFGRVPNGGLVLPPDTTTRVHRDPIIALAARYRLPAPKKSAGTFRHSRPLANGTRWGCRSALCRFPRRKKTLMNTHKHYSQIQRRCWTRIVCPGRAGIRARLARIATDGHGHPFIERRLWDGGIVSKLSKRFDFKWSRKWVRVI